jgi:peptidoglycan/xylan/chitin deacetylase (PgdA/CDA1 family)
VLRPLKLLSLYTARTLGVFELAARSGHRSQRLLILCYHGISTRDEHEWAPGLFMPPALFESRLKRLRQGGYSVLPLGEAVKRLREGSLPPRSVAITFDDGNVDFYREAWPLLKRFQVPATVYLTTYYSEQNLAVFPLALSYLLWKSRGKRAEVEILSGETVVIDATSPDARRQSEATILSLAQDRDLSAIDKDNVARNIAAAFGIDYEELRERRFLHLMNADEVAELATQGIDFQLHTHRHRSPLDEDRYRSELAMNRDSIQALTGVVPQHFCYPSGISKPSFEQWLKAEGVISATTCEPGMATPETHALRLPRLLDHSTLTDVEFDAWLCGLGALLPNRPINTSDVDHHGRLVIKRLTIPGREAAAAALSALAATIRTGLIGVEL